MTTVERAIIASSLMNTMFMYYRADEINKTAQTVRKKVSKYMRKRSKINRVEFLRVIKICDNAWKRTVDHFADDNIKIEAKATISAVYNNMNDVCVKQIGVREKLFEKFMICLTEDAEAEHNSDMVIEYFLKQIGLEPVKSSFTGKKLIIAGNIITDGKKIDDRFLPKK